MAKLIVLAKKYQGEHEIPEKGLTVGRADKADVVIPDNQLSRKHFEITFSAGEYFIADLGSTNGTELKGKTLKKKEKLADGDEIEIGKIKFRFSANGSVAEEESDIELDVGEADDDVSLDLDDDIDLPMDDKPARRNEAEVATTLAAPKTKDDDDLGIEDPEDDFKMEDPDEFNFDDDDEEPAQQPLKPDGFVASDEVETRKTDAARPAPKSSGKKTFVVPGLGAGAKLECKSGALVGEVFKLEGSSLTFGRKKTNGVVVPDNGISGAHAEIQATAGGYFIYDLESTNGTTVGGKKIKKQRIYNGDIIILGEVAEFEFFCEIAKKDVSKITKVSDSSPKQIASMKDLVVDFSKDDENFISHSEGGSGGGSFTALVIGGTALLVILGAAMIFYVLSLAPETSGGLSDQGPEEGQEGDDTAGETAKESWDRPANSEAMSANVGFAMAEFYPQGDATFKDLASEQRTYRTELFVGSNLLGFAPQRIAKVDESLFGSAGVSTGGSLTHPKNPGAPVKFREYALGDGSEIDVIYAFERVALDRAGDLRFCVDLSGSAGGGEFLYKLGSGEFKTYYDGSDFQKQVAVRTIGGVPPALTEEARGLVKTGAIVSEVIFGLLESRTRLTMHVFPVTGDSAPSAADAGEKTGFALSIESLGDGANRIVLHLPSGVASGGGGNDLGVMLKLSRALDVESFRHLVDRIAQNQSQSSVARLATSGETISLCQKGLLDFLEFGLEAAQFAGALRSEAQFLLDEVDALEANLHESRFFENKFLARDVVERCQKLRDSLPEELIEDRMDGFLLRQLAGFEFLKILAVTESLAKIRAQVERIPEIHSLAQALVTDIAASTDERGAEPYLESAEDMYSAGMLNYAEELYREIVEKFPASSAYAKAKQRLAGIADHYKMKADESDALGFANVATRYRQREQALRNYLK
ncbi:MAG: FHA domain-containing protein [Planctomycetes bacterium]|nr:FHA domain-containing protein [Planctomycetota bacterium]